MLGANPLPGIHEVDFNNTNTTNSSPLALKTGQLISKCPFGVIIWTKIRTKSFPGILP